MNIHWFRLGGMILSIVICFLTTVYCQDQNWNGHYYQHYSPSSIWVAQNHNNRGGDLELQSSMNRPSSSFGKMPWKNPQSKPQWQSPMYKPKWQDSLSKPQWQLSKAHHMKPFMKRPFKNSNSLNKQPHDQWRAGPKE
ncbi:uncharacterized protein [Parasteatoda tepidariorum]|uniref:uncharacterized protein n=1 Tax=Parasteatoda tepidariorum TaxID=114398 RepID=UPI001C727CC4|nr:uncharacterized protein LOC122271829 [Parasteatoda tepidariorum]